MCARRIVSVAAGHPGKGAPGSTGRHVAPRAVGSEERVGVDRFFRDWLNLVLVYDDAEHH